ncbi:MAG TPA: PIN domain-containing protein [Lacipirellulaceae bacterium]|nr:PIN domain-containing protein [Lacipirellulaceae bacterium]
MIFVDTGAWFARYVAADIDHRAATAWFAKVPDELVTTDYVIDELLTLLKVRGCANVAFVVGATLWSGVACRVEHVAPSDLKAAWHVFSTYRDKQWSFTDCVSRVVMERLSVTVACAFDEHFRQFGTVHVVP